jgi:hypothetical protein
VAAKGGPQPEVFAFSATTGARLPWALVPNGQPLSLAVGGGALYVGGHFTELSGQPRGSLAAVSLATATLLPWDPRPGFEVSELVVGDDTIYAAGTYYGGAQKAARAAAFRLGTNERLSFNPSLFWISDVKHLAAAKGRVIGTARSWYPPHSVGISFLHPEHGHVQGDLRLPILPTIAAGSRDAFIVGGTPDLGGWPGLGAFDAETGALLPWKVEISGQLKTIFVQPDFVAVGGGFVRAAGTAVGNFAVFRTARPSGPSAIRVAAVGSTVRLSWEPGPPPRGTSFIVEAGTTPGGSDVGRFGVGAATTVSGSLGSGAYYARVRGVSDAGEGAASSEVIFTLPPPASPPSAPGTLSATVTAGVVTLSWGAAAGNAAGYVLDVGSASGLTNIGSLATGHLDTAFATPAPSGVYFVRVRAVNAFGSSAATNEVQVVVP